MNEIHMLHLVYSILISEIQGHTVGHNGLEHWIERRGMVEGISDVEEKR